MTENTGEKNPRIRVAAIIVQDDSILLVRHVKDGQTYWLLPGGGVEFGESLEEALVRELQEEANLDIKVKDLVIANDSLPPDRHRHVLNLYFTAEIVDGELICAKDERIAEMRFMAIEKLPELTFYPDIREQLAEEISNDFPNRALYLGKMWKA